MFAWFVTNRRLSNQVRDLQAEIERLRIDWAEWYDRFRLLYARLAKRVERAASQAEESAPADSAARVVPGTFAAGLDERQSTIQNDILRRRRRDLQNG